MATRIDNQTIENTPDSSALVPIAQPDGGGGFNGRSTMFSDIISTFDLATITDSLQKTGGIMTGQIVLPGNPTLDLQTAPKQYVDAVRALIAPTKTFIVDQSGNGDFTNVSDALAHIVTLIPGGFYFGSRYIVKIVGLVGAAPFDGAAMAPSDYICLDVSDATATITWTGVWSNINSIVEIIGCGKQTYDVGTEFCDLVIGTNRFIQFLQPTFLNNVSIIDDSGKGSVPYMSFASDARLRLVRSNEDFVFYRLGNTPFKVEQCILPAGSIYLQGAASMDLDISYSHLEALIATNPHAPAGSQFHHNSFDVLTNVTINVGNSSNMVAGVTV